GRAERAAAAERARAEEARRDRAELEERLAAADVARSDEGDEGGDTDNGVPAGEENARLRAQLDALALDLARREGASQAADWQIAELERQVGELRAGAAAPQ